MEKSMKSSVSSKTEANILGYEKIGKLLKMFAIPSIISMLVNALYNIVDQAFIGQGIGYLGTGATNIIFPLTIAFASFALMLGDGASTYLSLKLGKGQTDEAARGVGNGILLSVIISISFAAIVLVFFPQFLNLFGCTAELESYAKDYGYIVAVGFPFFAICATINSVIRADGSPGFAMGSMLIGSVLNIILDPIFMFAFGLGIKGAALATVISQITSFTLNVLRLRKLKSIKLKGNLKLNFSIIKNIITLGASSFITQVFATIVMGIQNNLLKTYGALSVYGSEIPISIIGVIFKAVEILNSIVLGLAVGSQPIIGYNYGAKNFDRVKKTLRTVVIYGLIVSVVIFTLFQTIPDKIILLFGGGGNDLYIEFAKKAFRLYTMFIVGSSVIVPAITFLQAIGKGGKSAALSMMRQAIAPILGMFIMGRFFGIFGVVSARAIADGLAFLLSVALLAGELRSLGRGKSKSTTLAGNADIGNVFDRQILVSVSREYGSGGHIGKLIAENLGIKFYDKDIIVKLAEQTGLSEEYIEDNEQKRSAISNFHKSYAGADNADELFIKEARIIEEIADQESCVIIGRCADYILENRENLVKVFVYSGMEDKIKRAVTYYGLDKDKAEKEIKRNDKERAIHYKHYTNRNWSNKSNYDICVNSDFLGVEKTAELVCAMIKERLNISEKEKEEIL